MFDMRSTCSAQPTRQVIGRLFELPETKGTLKNREMTLLSGRVFSCSEAAAWLSLPLVGTASFEAKTTHRFVNLANNRILDTLVLTKGEKGNAPGRITTQPSALYMSNINKVILIGNVGTKPEIRSTASGKNVANFSLATHRAWKDDDGELQEQTQWHNIVCWGRGAEIAEQYLTKGKQVYVEGHLQDNSWEDQETGEKRLKTEIICERLQMLGRKEASAGALEIPSDEPVKETAAA